MDSLGLSQLVWFGPSLHSLSRQRVTGAPSLTIHLPASKGRGLSIPTPFLLLHAPWTRLGMDSSVQVVAAVKQVGGMVYAPREVLEKTPASDMPPILLSIWSDEFPSVEELSTADAICLHFESAPSSKAGTKLGDSQQGEASWPIEVPDLSRLRKKVSFVRELTSGNAPIGTKFDQGNVAEDMAVAIQAGFDFVILDCSSNLSSGSDAISLPPTSWAVATARQVAIQKGKAAIPVLVQSAADSSDALAKLAALGATGFIVDAVVKPVIEDAFRSNPAHSISPGGMFSGIGMPVIQPKASLQSAAVTARLQSIAIGLQAIVQRQFKPSLDKLNTRDLIAMDEKIGKLTGVAVLSNAEVVSNSTDS